jgi:hypothetical protein
MSPSRFFAVAVSGAALAVLLTVSVSAQEGFSPKGKAPDGKPGVLDRGKPGGPPQRDQLSKPKPERPDPFFPGPPDGLGRPPGPPPGEDSMRPGPPGRPGRGLAPGGPHPPGPPRWPFWDWESLEKNDPEMYKLLKEEAELDRRTFELVAQYRRAPGPQRDEIKKELEKLVNQHFDVRQKRRHLEIKRLEEGLQRLRDAIEQRNKARKEVVGKRVVELLGQQDDIGF